MCHACRPFLGAENVIHDHDQWLSGEGVPNRGDNSQTMLVTTVMGTAIATTKSPLLNDDGVTASK